MKASAIFRPDLLKDQVIVITGGGSGIGRAIALECAALGAHVAIGARKRDRLEETAQELRALGAQVWLDTLDIRDQEGAAAWVQAAWEHFGHIDTLVNNAGGQFPSPAVMIRPKGWRAVIDTNLNGTWWMTQEVGRRMIERGQGKVINIVANMWRGFPGMAHTGAARAGVVNLTRTLALEWARAGVLVNAVAPGVIRSSGLDNYDPAIQAMLDKEVPAQIPLRRLGSEQDVAWSVVYLASAAGDYITGETVCVDGGQAHWGNVFPV
jgi:citronellol/citronellal dehydrogenase